MFGTSGRQVHARSSTNDRRLGNPTQAPQQGKQSTMDDRFIKVRVLWKLQEPYLLVRANGSNRGFIICIE
jgi:hypothetical protein